MEISVHAQYNCFAFFNPFSHVRPFAGKFDSSLNSFCACVHGEHHVVAEEGGDLLCELSKHGVVECARGEGEFLSLRDKRCDDAGVTMALVNGPTVMAY
jgi:hypothetical protein